MKVYAVCRGVRFEGSSIEYICSTRERARIKAWAIYNLDIKPHWEEHDEEIDTDYWSKGCEYVSIREVVLDDAKSTSEHRIDELAKRWEAENGTEA